MNSQFEANDLTDAAQGEPSLIASIRKIQRHLVFLEKKIDTLIEQSKGRSFNRSSHFSKPHKPHNQSNRSDHYNQNRQFDKSPRSDSRDTSRNEKRRFRGGQFNPRRSTAGIKG